MTQELTYKEESKMNEDVFKQIVHDIRPDIWSLLTAIDETKVNSFVIFKVIYALNNVMETTKYGNVVIEVEDGTVRFIRGQSNFKINEPLVKDARVELGYASE
jgi:hypothetical protein